MPLQLAADKHVGRYGLYDAGLAHSGRRNSLAIISMLTDLRHCISDARIRLARDVGEQGWQHMLNMLQTANRSTI